MFRYIEQGRISATNNRAGQKQIAVSELLRVFGELQPETVTETTAATVRDTKRQGPAEACPVMAEFDRGAEWLR